MITTILSDFSRVILFPKDKNYKGTLNGLYGEALENKQPFNFFDFFEFNEEILSLYVSLKDKYSLNIFTSGIIQKAKEVERKIKPIFDNIYTASDFGLSKKQQDAYLFIANKLRKNPTEIVYIDDKLDNCKVAEKAGMKTIHYEEFTKFKNQFVGTLNV